MSCHVPEVDLPAHFNERERMLRHIPTGHAKPTLEILHKVVAAVGTHWPTADDTASTCCSESHFYCDKSPRSDSSTPASPSACKKADSAQHPEIVISMDLGSGWNELYVASVANALGYLFSIGFQYDAKKNEMVFDSLAHVKEAKEAKNADLPTPYYMCFDAPTLLREIDAAADWHRRRMVYLSEKMKNSKGSRPATIAAKAAALRGSQNALTPIDEEEVDADLKCAINVEVDSLLNDKLCIVRDDRTREDIKEHVKKSTKAIERAQNHRARMLKY